MVQNNTERKSGIGGHQQRSSCRPLFTFFVGVLVLLQWRIIIGWGLITSSTTPAFDNSYYV